MAGWDLLLCFGSFCLTAEMFHLLGLLRKSIECWQSLEGKLKTAFLLIWKYSAPQLICVFTPNVSFVSYKARGSSRINESQYFYNIQRFSWESPRFTDGWNSITWFVWVCFVVFFLISIFFSPLMLSEQKTPCKFWRAFSRMQRSDLVPAGLPGKFMIAEHTQSSLCCLAGFWEFSPFPWQAALLHPLCRCCFSLECRGWKIGVLQPILANSSSKNLIFFLNLLTWLQPACTQLGGNKLF